MATNKSAITTSNIHGWLASLGYLFPSTEGELLRFERLHADMRIPENELLDPDVIMGKKLKKENTRNQSTENSFDSLRMAARNGAGDIPEHILRKMKNNHKKPGNLNDGSEEEKAD